MELIDYSLASERLISISYTVASGPDFFAPDPSRANPHP